MQAIFANASAEEGSDFVVFGEPARLTQPGKSPLHNLALGQRLKTVAPSFAHFSKVLGQHLPRRIGLWAHGEFRYSFWV